MYRFRRWLKREINRRLYHLDRGKILAALKSVGVERGTVVCVHSALSRLGHIEGGPDTVIDALMEVVGPDGGVLMPSFPTDGSGAKWLDEGNVFDVRNSPSKVGLLTEVFRRREGVMRSLHPTNPLAGWGGRAEAFLRDHEKSPTPYGHDTPYGRLVAADDAFVLMLETHVQSLLHHVQERVDFPNLFLPQVQEAEVVDWDGNRQTIRTRILRPRIPYFIAVPSDRAPEPDWAILHDFMLMFPRARRREMEKLGYRFNGYPVLYRRRARLEDEGVLKVGRMGRGEIGLLHAKGFINHVEPEFRDMIARFGSFYDVERIAAMNLPYT